MVPLKNNDEGELISRSTPHDAFCNCSTNDLNGTLSKLEETTGQQKKFKKQVHHEDFYEDTCDKKCTVGMFFQERNY